MNKDDKKWLLSSISKAWREVRKNAGNGWIWTERDVISSLYRHLVPLVQSRNQNGLNDLGELRVLTELNIYKTKNKFRPLDMVIVSIDDSRVPIPYKILVHIEMKCKVGYSPSFVKTQEMPFDFRKFIEFDRRWKTWWVGGQPYTPSFIIAGLVAGRQGNQWSEYLYQMPSSPKDGGILHPNGKRGIPKLSEFGNGARYFELHGPFFRSETSLDYILGESSHWGFFEIEIDGSKREIL